MPKPILYNELTDQQILGSGKFGEVSLYRYRGNSSKIKSLCTTIEYGGRLYYFLAIKAPKTHELDPNFESEVNLTRKLTASGSLRRSQQQLKNSQPSIAKPEEPEKPDAYSYLNTRSHVILGFHGDEKIVLISPVIYYDYTISMDEEKQEPIFQFKTASLDSFFEHKARHLIIKASTIEQTALLDDYDITQVQLLVSAYNSILEIHADNALHLDIALRNFLVDKPIQQSDIDVNFRARACDFGLSQMKGPDGKVYEVHGEGILRPTYYLSSNRLNLERTAITDNDDAYSFRIMFLEALLKNLDEPLISALYFTPEGKGNFEVALVTVNPEKPLKTSDLQKIFAEHKKPFVLKKDNKIFLYGSLNGIEWGHINSKSPEVFAELPFPEIDHPSVIVTFKHGSPHYDEMKQAHTYRETELAFKNKAREVSDTERLKIFTTHFEELISIKQKFPFFNIRNTITISLYEAFKPYLLTMPTDETEDRALFEQAIMRFIKSALKIKMKTLNTDSKDEVFKFLVSVNRLYNLLREDSQWQEELNNLIFREVRILKQIPLTIKDTQEQLAVVRTSFKCLERFLLIDDLPRYLETMEEIGELELDLLEHTEDLQTLKNNLEILLKLQNFDPQEFNDKNLKEQLALIKANKSFIERTLDFVNHKLFAKLSSQLSLKLDKAAETLKSYHQTRQSVSDPNIEQDIAHKVHALRTASTLSFKLTKENKALREQLVALSALIEESEEKLTEDKEQIWEPLKNSASFSKEIQMIWEDFGQPVENAAIESDRDSMTASEGSSSPDVAPTGLKQLRLKRLCLFEREISSSDSDREDDKKKPRKEGFS